MTEEEEVAQEICDVEEYQTILVEKISFVRDFLETTVSPLTPLSPPTATKTSTLPTSLSSTSSPPRPGVVTENPSEANTPSTETLPEANIEPPVNLIVTEMPSGDIVTNVSSVTSSVQHTRHANEGYEYTTRLPKLNLPYIYIYIFFSGDPLMWQTFWDSFSAAVHNNNPNSQEYRNLIISEPS